MHARHAVDLDEPFNRLVDVVEQLGCGNLAPLAARASWDALRSPQDCLGVG